MADTHDSEGQALRALPGDSEGQALRALPGDSEGQALRALPGDSEGQALRALPGDSEGQALRALPGDSEGQALRALPWLGERRQPRDSLATKIIFFVFVSTFITSLVVSWVSVHSSYSFTRRHLERTRPALLLAREEALVRALAGSPALLERLRQEPSEGPSSLGPVLERALRAALSPPPGEAGAGLSLHLVDAAGRILVAGASDAARPSAFPLGAAAGRGPLFQYRDADGRRGVAAYRRLPFADWGLVVAQSLDQAYAPVFSVLTRILVIDLAVVLLFSLLAYEITAAIVRPLEALSEAARRISQGELEVEIADTRTLDEIGLLTRTFNDMARRLRRNRGEIEQQHRQLREQNEQLQQANEVLEQLSITDGLTKLHNHRYFQEALTREIKRVTRTQKPLAILLVDIDDFKALNDQLGHADGDAVLVRIARILNESVRESDVLARYGGEEFVVLATGTDLEGALFLAEKVRMAVAEARFALDSSQEPTRVTVSIGVAQFTGDRRSFFDSADRALYRAKAAGKNCVVLADDPLGG